MLHSDFGSHPSAFNRRLGAHGWIGTTWQKRRGGERSMFERSSASDRHHTERGYFANKFGATPLIDWLSTNCSVLQGTGCPSASYFLGVWVAKAPRST
jgi:hypothetical protein